MWKEHKIWDFEWGSLFLAKSDSWLTDISALASLRNIAKWHTWYELQNPANHWVFEHRLRLKPLGRGYVCLRYPLFGPKRNILKGFFSFWVLKVAATFCYLSIIWIVCFLYNVNLPSSYYWRFPSLSLLCWPVFANQFEVTLALIVGSFLIWKCIKLMT